MQYSEEWKSLFPISSVHSPPLLVQNSSSLGPLFFNPVPESLSLLFSSSNLSPPVLPPPPHTSLPRFVRTSTPRDSSVLPTTASAVAASINSKDHCKSSDFILHNRLELLYCPNNQVFIFFPTGSNLDSVGFFVLSVRDSKLAVDFASDDSILASSFKCDHRIVQLTACPVSDCSFCDEGGSPRVGFLLACSMYGANWFSVQISGHCLAPKKPALVFIGSKKFTSAMVVHACWNPHLPGECVILLESGALFLFEMESCLDKGFGGKRIRVPWHELGESADSGWFSCEFSWHPRILVIANSKAIYLTDLRFGKCQPTCLLSIDMPGPGDLIEKDKFVVFSKAGNDGFLYTVASEQWLLLCDIRKPLMPLLRWAHYMHKPRYMTVLSLCDLRSIPHDRQAEASAVVLGSFWNNEFSFFCYGRPHPAVTKSLSRNISNFSYSFYAWELPSLFLLGGHSCPCGNCLLREKFAKEDNLAWIEWQQKQDLVLGFCILNKGLSSSMPQTGELGGFTLIRLMSTGKLESQQFCASWNMTRVVATHGKATVLKDSPLCSLGDEEYKFPRKFQYVKLENLYSHLSNNLARVLFTKFRNIPAVSGLKTSSSERFHKFMSENSVSCDPPMSHLLVADVFRDVSMPTSLYQIVSRLMWTSLPMNILELAFPDFSEALDQKNMPLEFPAIPDQDQCPPFFLRNPAHRGIKSSSKVQNNENFVGPVCPLPALVVLNEISKCGYSFVGDVNNFSPEDIFAHQCKFVMRLTKEMCILDIDDKQEGAHAVSLNEDRDEILADSSETRSLFLYKPSAFLDEMEERENSVLGESFDTVVAKFAEDDDHIFAGLCPMELKFDYDSEIEKLSTEESVGYKFLKNQFLHWQNGFMPYQNLQSRLREKEKQPHC